MNRLMVAAAVLVAATITACASETDTFRGGHRTWR
jgi:hypothetical protein